MALTQRPVTVEHARGDIRPVHWSSWRSKFGFDDWPWTGTSFAPLTGSRAMPMNCPSFVLN